MNVLKPIDRVSEAVDKLKTKYSSIIKKMTKRRKEISGIITNSLKIKTTNTGSMVEVKPEKIKCFACWHSHPPLSVLTQPEEDVLFTPPSHTDLYYALIGKSLSKYNHSFVISFEGIYRITPTDKAAEFCVSELAELLSSDDPWRLPAEPIDRSRYDFHGMESSYPYMVKLFNMKIDWDKSDLDSAVSSYIDEANKLHITVEFYKM